MVFFTGSGSLDIAFDYLAIYVFGSPEAVGLYFFTLLFIGAMMLRIDFVVALVALVPVNVVLVAYGMITPVVAGLHIIIVFVAFALAFFRDKG